MSDDDGVPAGAPSVVPAPLDSPLLIERYRGVVFDVDGVLVRDTAPIPGAAATLAVLRARGIGIALVTNNASRTASEVAALLGAAGIAVAAEEVITSAAVAAGLLESGTRCLVIGTEGLRQPLTEHGCVVTDDPAEADAVVVGWDRGLVWDDLRRATTALLRGARFVATNSDVTYPSPEGPWPGNGAVVAALEATAGRRAEVAGKPGAAMFAEAARRLGDGPLLMVGDRPETDLAGAAALGWDTALVETGITAAGAAEAVRPRPTYVLPSVAALPAWPDLMPARGVASDGGGTPWSFGVRSARASDTDAVLSLWDEGGMLGYTRDARAEIARVLGHDPSLFLVATDDDAGDRVVGVLLGTCDGRRGWLMRLAVEPAWRLRGVGRLLVDEVERALAECGIPQANLLVFADNADANAFWERLGYRANAPVELRTKRLD